MAAEGQDGKELPPLRVFVAATVRSRREAAHLSVRALAQRAGLSRGSVHAVERGTEESNTGTLERVCTAFGISMTELYAEAERRRRG